MADQGRAKFHQDFISLWNVGKHHLTKGGRGYLTFLKFVTHFGRKLFAQAFEVCWLVFGKVSARKGYNVIDCTDEYRRRI